jgi:hypothetical protein
MDIRKVLIVGSGPLGQQFGFQSGSVESPSDTIRA